MNKQKTTRKAAELFSRSISDTGFPMADVGTEYSEAQKMSDAVAREYAEIEEHWQATEEMLQSDHMWTQLEDFVKEPPKGLFQWLRSVTGVFEAAFWHGKSRRWSWVFGAGVAVAVLILAVWLPATVTTSDQIEYFTNVGEQKNIVLADGSLVKLNTNSRVAVAIDGKSRSLELVKGQAYFQVAKDPARPFTVDYGHGSVKVVGTAFDIYRDRALSTITLIEGEIEVRNAVGSSGLNHKAESVYSLVAGDTEKSGQLMHHSNGVISMRNISIAEVTAWQSSKMVFTDWTLERAIKEINRYTEYKIILGHADLKEKRISGVFYTQKPDILMNAICAYFPIKVFMDEQGNQVLMPK